MADAMRDGGPARPASAGRALLHLMRRLLVSADDRTQLMTRIRAQGLEAVLRLGAASPPTHVKMADAASPRNGDQLPIDWKREAEVLKDAIRTGGRASTPGLYARLARARRMSGDLRGGAKAVARGLERYGEDAGLLRERAEIEMAEERWRPAANTWARVVELGGRKTSATVFLRWSTALQKAGSLLRAGKALERGLKLHPDDTKLASEAADLAWERNARAREEAPPAPSQPLNVERMCDLFWEMEQRLSLLDWRIGDIAPWPLLRMPLYYNVTQRLGLFDAPHPTLKSRIDAARGWTDELEAAWAEQEAAFRIGRRPSDGVGSSAVLMATRKVGGEEPYTQAVRSELGDKALLFDVSPETAPGVLPFHAYKDLFRERYRRRELYRVPQEAYDICRAVWSTLLDALGVDAGNLGRTCRNRVADFDAVSRGFETLFKGYCTKTLYLTNAYGSTNRAVVHAARNAGARVVELQHGFISRYHLGYSWPGRPDVPYCPDELWCFGSYWPETTPLPKTMAARVIGAPYVEALAKAAEGPRDANLVVFTSQGVIGRKLFEVALETARRRPDRRFLFRLHPNESREDYETLLAEAGGAPANFAISHQTPNIFALLASASIQVGVFSTTLFEGMKLGTRTVIVDMPGVEYMRPAVERGDALLVRDVDELAAKLDQAPLCADPKCYYATPASPLL